MVVDVEDAPIQGNRVLCRVDFNVPMQNGKIIDDSRIRASLPTLKYILQKNGHPIILSHLGRPKGFDPNLSLKPITKILSDLLKCEVLFISSLKFDEIRQTITEALGNGIHVFLLENTRFFLGETKNDPNLAKEFASLADIFVSDAFGAVHRTHASTVGVTKYLPSFAGKLVAKEYQNITQAMNHPQRPALAIIGGAKISTKLSIIEKLLDITDSIIIGGAMVYTFIVSKGGKVGTSLIEKSMITTAADLLNKSEQKGVRIILPVDVRLAIDLITPKKENSRIQTSDINNIPKNLMGLDIGPQSEKIFQEEIDKANTIIWNGPLGVFEQEVFRKGTANVCEHILSSQAKIIIGGGDTIYALKLIHSKAIPDNVHVSTGGGASLELMSGKSLPGITCLNGKIN